MNNQISKIYPGFTVAFSGALIVLLSNSDPIAIGLVGTEICAFGLMIMLERWPKNEKNGREGN